MKRFVALTLAAVMSAGMAMNVSAASFSDINNVPWEGAKEYINNAADLGLMVGDTDSKGQKVFRAKDKITYCEAMQLAYSVLKGSDSLKTSVDAQAKWKSTMQSANIPEWAYPAVSYGLETGVLSANDIKIFMKSAGVNRDATRENVAVIFGKALSHISDVNTSATLTFKDKDEITATSVPYIDLLARLNILVGDDNGSFNPKNYINRAEMAVIASKSYNKINDIKKESAAQQSGAVQSIKGTIILTDNGSSQKTIAISDSTTRSVSTYTINSSTPVITLDGVAKSYDDISLGDVVTVAVSNGVVVSIVINEDKADVSEEELSTATEGYLNNITSYAVTLDTESGKQARYEFASNPRITLNGGLISKDDLYNYVTDRHYIYAELTLDSTGKIVSLETSFKDVEGELTNVKDGYVYVKLEYGGKSKSVKVEVASDCQFYLDSEKISDTKAEKLFTEEDKKGYYAVVEVNSNDKAKKVEIFHDTYTNGELVSISASDIEMKSNFGRTVNYEFDDEAKFYLNGSESTYKKIRDALSSSDMLVTLEFDGDLVTSVKAQQKEIQGKLDTVDDKAIIIIDSNNNEVILKISGNMKCTLNDEEIAYTNLKRFFKETENTVVANVKLNDDLTVSSIIANEGSDYEGELVSLTSSSITFTDVVGAEHTYKIEPAARGYVNGEEYINIDKAVEAGKNNKKVRVKITLSSRGYANRVYITTD